MSKATSQQGIRVNITSVDVIHMKYLTTEDTSRRRAKITVIFMDLVCRYE